MREVVGDKLRFCSSRCERPTLIFGDVELGTDRYIRYSRYIEALRTQGCQLAVGNVEGTRKVQWYDKDQETRRMIIIKGWSLVYDTIA